MENKNFNEVLKAREAEEKARKAAVSEKTDGSEPLALDDSQRVKVLSPGRLVFNRFIRNRLAIVGSCILIFMFLFSFLFPVFYPYGQTDIFYKYDTLLTNYASAVKRDSYTSYVVDQDHTVNSTLKNMMTSYILKMEQENVTKQEITDDESGLVYNLNKLGDSVYEITGIAADDVAELTGFTALGMVNTKSGVALAAEGHSISDDVTRAAVASVAAEETAFEVGGEVYSLSPAGKKGLYNLYSLSKSTLTMTDGSKTDAAFLNAVMHGVASGKFTYDSIQYGVNKNATDKFTVVRYSDASTLLVASKLVFNAMENGKEYDDEFKAAALLAIYGEGSFGYNGTTYRVAAQGDEFIISGASGDEAMLSLYSVRRYNGEDTLSIDFKRTAKKEIEKMEAAGQKNASFTYPLPMMDEEGRYVVNEDGSYNLEDSELSISRKEGQYVFQCEQTTHLIDIYGPASKKHFFGTDADGMDILARMMYGGRISLMVGFVVVILELIFGVILGGLAGFFSGWVDTFIMRLVDIFNCIPVMPILIILGAIFDDQKLTSYVRLMWMMAVLGFLGWAGVARLVRGQILSLREQEFMTAAEATGLSTSRRIFRHLVPNVIPQLIVNATMGLGSVIIYESTLSFLGLGVKHPLATWGTMINSVTSSNENMIRYAYIWIPVGMLICLTVIAFNFVGDGLRDAFDPKMK